MPSTVVPTSTRKRNLCALTLVISICVFAACLTILVLSLTRWAGNDCMQKYSCEVSCFVEKVIQPNYYHVRNCTNVVLDTSYTITLSTNKVLYLGDPVEVFINRDNDNCSCPNDYGIEHYHSNMMAYSDNAQNTNIHSRLFYLYITLVMGSCVPVIASIIYFCRRVSVL